MGGAIHVNLTTILMHDIANFTHGFFVYAMGRWVSDHRARKVITHFFCFSSQIVKVNVTIFVTGDYYDFQANHLRRSRVSSVGRAWDQAHITMPFTTAFVVALDSQQPGVFTLGTGVWLHGKRIITGNAD